MICKECKFENKEGAAFCANCGKPIVADSENDVKPASSDEEKTTIIETEEKQGDDSEGDTTVLTSNAPMGGMPPMGTVPPMGNVPPMGGVSPMGGSAPVNNGMPAKPAKPGKPAKAAKPAKVAKPKKSKGTVAYIVISIILILGLAGVGVWGYFYFTGEIDDLKEEKANATAELTVQYEKEIEDLQASNDELELSVADYESQIALNEEKISQLQADVDGYTAYEEILNAISTSVPQGSTSFFASNNIVRVSEGDTAEIKIYYADLDGTIQYYLENSSVATCEFGEGWENDETTATLYVEGLNAGVTRIEISNTTDDQIIEIIVYVD